MEGESLFAPISPSPGGNGERHINYYEILEIPRGADRTEIRAAYIRLKSNLSAHNGARYSLIGSDESDHFVEQIEEAYKTLEDEALRLRYDQALDAGVPFNPLESKPNNKSRPKIRKFALKSLDSVLKQSVEELIEDATEINGELFFNIRQLLGVSPEEVQSHLKISPWYLKAIEEDQFAELPPPVYVRGFLKSLLEYLGVSSDKVGRLLDGYLRIYSAWSQKNSKKRS